MTSLAPVSESLDDYLAADEVIDHQHPAIRSLAARLRRATREQTARAAFEYVKTEIAHSYDIDRWSAAYRASDVLAAGDAICHGQSHLLVALLRASGIPAGICYQQVGAPHALVAVHWPDPDRWVRIDPRGNRPDLTAEFATAPGQERTCYPDAFDYPGIFAAVPAELAAALAKAQPGKPGWDYLPDSLGSSPQG